jgi:hypothetical protein
VRHEVHDLFHGNFCHQCRGQGEIDKFQLRQMMRVSAIEIRVPQRRASFG